MMGGHEIRVGRFSVELIDNPSYTEVAVRMINEDDGDSETTPILWVDDADQRPRIYLHHDEEHRNDPMVFDIERRT